MPLIQSSSKKALQKNIKTEMEAHPGAKHRMQDLAIGYAVKRRNMFSGGEAESDKQRSEERHVDQNCMDCKAMSEGGPACMYHGGMKEDPGQNTPKDELGHIESGDGKPDQENQEFAMGGMANPAEHEQGDDHNEDYLSEGIAERILKSRKESLPSVDALHEDGSQEKDEHSDLESAQELEHMADEDEKEDEMKRTWQRAMSRRSKTLRSGEGSY
jgi:hypothetical protein